MEWDNQAWVLKVNITKLTEDTLKQPCLQFVPCQLRRSRVIVVMDLKRVKVRGRVLRPTQQPGSYQDKPFSIGTWKSNPHRCDSATLSDYMPNLLASRSLGISKGLDHTVYKRVRCSLRFYRHISIYGYIRSVICKITV